MPKRQIRAADIRLRGSANPEPSPECDNLACRSAATQPILAGIAQETSGEMHSATRILDEIENRRSDLVLLTQELIRIPTLNPPGAHYLEICEFLRKRLRGSGYDCSLIRAQGAPADSDRHPSFNLVARRPGPRPGACVHFNSHTDVVQVGEGWTVDPFAGEIRGDRVYGRGSCDMKGGLAASIVAAEAFAACFPDYCGAIEI